MTSLSVQLLIQFGGYSTLNIDRGLPPGAQRTPSAPAAEIQCHLRHFGVIYSKHYVQIASVRPSVRISNSNDRTIFMKFGARIV
jgi:hypothetical protein